LLIKDTTYKAEKKQDEPTSVKIKRRFPENNVQSSKPDLVLQEQGDSHDCNILLYVENLGARVSGTLEYDEVDTQTNQKTEKKLEINEFFLDLTEGNELIKNHSFVKFWSKFEELEQRMQNSDLPVATLQDQIESQVQSEDERQAMKMQQMMREMQQRQQRLQQDQTRSRQ